jgi:hypothetical protein
MTALESPDYQIARDRIKANPVITKMAAGVATVPLAELAHEDGTPRFAFMQRANRAFDTAESQAFTMWGIAAVVIVVTAAGGEDAAARWWVYRVAAGLLVALGALTALTGARTPVVWFKICPVLLAGSAALLVAASLV